MIEMEMRRNAEDAIFYRGRDVQNSRQLRAENDKGDTSARASAHLRDRDRPV